MQFKSEKHLIKELKKYNENAFDHIVRQYQNLILNYVTGMVHNREEAWNISQEVFISVFRHIKDFKGDASLKTWMMRIARNQAINKIRYLNVRKSSAHRSIDHENAHYLQESISTGEDPVQELLLRESKELVLSILEQFSPEDQELLVLHYINELSYGEIIDLVEITPGALKSKLFRLRQKFKTYYLEQGGDHETPS